MATHHTLPHAHLSPARLYSLFYLEDSTLLQSCTPPPAPCGGRRDGHRTRLPYQPESPPSTTWPPSTAVESSAWLIELGTIFYTNPKERIFTDCSEDPL